MIEVTPSSIDTAIYQADRLVLLEFWAPGCTQCEKIKRQMEPLMEALGDQVVFAGCNISAWPNLPAAYGILSVPTLILLIQGEVIEIFSGKMDIGKIEKAVRTTLINRPPISSHQSNQ